MPRPLKIFRHHDVLFVTTTVEQGLLLPANALVRLLILSCLARAQALFPVTISAFLVEGTHLHLLLVVLNPEDVADFMERFKTESAHAINALLGRRGRTVWCDGYDSPVLGNPEDVVRKLVYLYTNPAKDGLVPSIHQYPGLSSFPALAAQEKCFSFKAPRILRPTVKPLRKGRRLRASEYQKIADELSAEAPFCHSLTIEVEAWMDAFRIPESARPAFREDLLAQIALSEKGYQEERARLNKGYLGAERLAEGGFDLDYVSPTRHGRRTICICADRGRRRELIAWARELRAAGKAVLQRWREGDLSVPYPAGLFPPSLPRRWNLVPRSV